MRRSKHINTREPSKVKPFLYLLLQIIIVVLTFGIFNRSFNISEWSFIEIIIALGFIVYFLIRTFAILRRTNAVNNEWHDKIQMQRYLQKK